jgi:hypothetical protein
MDDRLKLGWRGFEQAERQLLDEIQKSGDPLVPLAHLMQWAYAIDQWYTACIADGKNELVRLFGADTVGETYNGFRAARASVAHDLSLVADLVTRPLPRILQAGGGGRRGGRSVIIRPSAVSEWLWTQAPAIPPNNKGLPFYQKHLAGKPISDCLPAVREFLEVRLPDLLARKPNPP